MRQVVMQNEIRAKEGRCLEDKVLEGRSFETSLECGGIFGVIRALCPEGEVRGKFIGVKSPFRLELVRFLPSGRSGGGFRSVGPIAEVPADSR